MQLIEGGVCAAKGFTAAGIHCGLRKKDRLDLALIVSDNRARVACVYTQNLVCGAPVTVTKQNVQDGFAKAIICNSGNANTCNTDGEKVALDICRIAGDALKINPLDVVVASTGIVGKPFDITPIKEHIHEIVSALDSSKQASSNAAAAIVTTDLVQKEVAVSFKLGDKDCTMGGIAKGSGMMHPNMATMLIFITTDVSISQELLQKALSDDVIDTFNMISIDGDTSTNDMVTVLANGMAENPEITCEGDDYDVFCSALREMTLCFCRMIAKDGEGASKLLICNVKGGCDTAAAKMVAKSVICSSLVKTAMFGADANWGRILCAIGYSGASVDVCRIGVEFSSGAGNLLVCRDGVGLPFDEDIAKKILSEDEIDINITLESGDAQATAWGCDLTYDYVKINGDYRS